MVAIFCIYFVFTFFVIFVSHSKLNESLIIFYLLSFDITRRIQNSFAYARQLSADKAPSEATFRGSEFLSYDLGQTGGEPIVSAQDAISLYFRTRQPNGLLFYTSECDFLVLHT